MRETLTALAALVVLALAAMLVGPHVIDWNGRRGEVAAFIEARTGLPVRINGTLSISLLPTLDFDGEGVEIGPAEAPILHAGRATFSLSPMALLRGEYRFSSLRLDRVALSRAALTARFDSARETPDLSAFAKIGVDQGEVRGARLVTALVSGVLPANAGEAYDGTFEAPSLLGPYRVQIDNSSAGRDFRAQIGQIEGGRARIKGVAEDKPFGARILLDGWAAIPGPAGRPVFDGSVTINGNPMVASLDMQVPFVVTGRVMAYSDQVIADPLNLTLGGSDGGMQMQGQAFADLRPQRPEMQVKLSARRLDFKPFTAEAAPARKEQVDWQNLLSGLSSVNMPFDMALTFGAGQVQIAGGSIQNVALTGEWRASGPAIRTLQAELPGRTSLSLSRRAGAGSEAVDGALSLEARDAQGFAAWVRGGEAPAAFPAEIQLSATAKGGLAGLAFSDLRLASPSGELTGSGEWRPALTVQRGAPKLVFDLAAERFDARVLAALEPLRPLGGSELSLRLGVRKLVLDGQETGGLQVVLDRDPATASLRQFRLTGRKGEVLSLAGTASGDGMQMTAKLDAERLGDLAALAGTLLPGPATQAFATRARFLEPAIAIANLRATTREGRTTWGVEFDGKLGGSTLSGKGQSALLREGDVSVALTVDLANPDGGRLLGQITGLEGKFERGRVPGSLSIRAEGNPREAIGGSIHAVLAGIDLGFEGTLNPFRSMPLEGSFQMSTQDFSVLGDLPAFAGQSGRLAGKVFADRNKIQLLRLDGLAGGEPVSGELAFDLARQGHVTGQIKLRSVSLPLLLSPVFGRELPFLGGDFSSKVFVAGRAPPLSGDLWIEAQNARLADGVTFDKSEFVWRFAPGMVGFDNLDARSGEAKLSGSALFLRKGERVEIGGRIGFARWPVAALLTRASGEVPFNAAGETPQALVAALSGAGRVAFDDLVVPGVDPAALARITAMSLDALQPINENRIGGLIEQELRKGDLRLAAPAAPLGLLNGVIRIALPPKPGAGNTMVTSVLGYDVQRREAEAKFTLSQTDLPKDWSGAVPEISLSLLQRGEGAVQRRLQVASLVNGFLAMAIQRDLERAEAFEADVRERAMHLRRQKADAWLQRREREIKAAEEQLEAEAAALRRRANEPPASPPPGPALPLDLVPKLDLAPKTSPSPG